MKRRLARCLGLLAGLAWGCASGAPAYADSGSITGITQVGQYEVSATFTATRDTCQQSYCGWFPVAHRAGVDQDCTTSNQPVWVGPSRDALGTVTETTTFYPISVGQAGPVKLCVLIYYSGMYHPVAETTFNFPLTAPQAPMPTAPVTPAVPVAPAPPPTPSAGHGDLLAAPIYGTLGLESDFSSFALSSDRVPASIGLDRWKALVDNAADRWGLTNAGNTYGTPLYGDGSDEVGFGPVRSGALATQNDSFIVRYKRKRTCKGSGRTRRCFARRRVVSATLVDRDIRVNPYVRWQPGPATPDATQYDLLTVLLHEFGHFAGNLRHSSRCRSTPMVVSLDRGEWWHSAGDSRVTCRGSATAFAAAAGGRRITHTVTRTWIEAGDRSVKGARARSLVRLQRAAAARG